MRNDEMYLQLYIIRHAESLGNIETEESFDKVNPPLSVHGKKQAEKLGERFKARKSFTLYASPLERARDTAMCISSDIIFDDDLLEQGTKKTENGFDEFNETDDECFKRAKRIIDKIKQKHSNHENVIIVSHGSFSQSLFRACLNIGNTMRFAVYNTSVSKINFSREDLPKLALQNDISHLAETDGEKLFWM